MAFVVFALVAKPGTLFYEEKVYIHYLSSIISDFDFNIINQVPRPMAWLVTNTYFHPDPHTESQSALFFPFYLLELVTKTLSFTKVSPLAHEFQFALTSLATNLFSLFLGFYFLFEICKKIDIKAKATDFVVFTLGTAFFYFSFLQTSVLEVTAFPLLAYLLLVYFNLRDKQNPHSPAVVGLVCGFLFIAKVTFWPACLSIACLFSLNLFKKRQWPNLAYFLSAFSAVLFASTVNKFIKYGYFFPPAPPLSHFFTFSTENLGRNLLFGFFPEGGLFYANPLYFVSIVGWIMLLANLFTQKKISFFFLASSAIWFSLIFLGNLGMIGYIVEDHLPGRIHLAFLPWLAIGLVYLRNIFSEKFHLGLRYFSYVCVAWHLVITASYVVLIQGSSFVYSTNMLPKWEVFADLWPRYFVRISENASGIAAHFPQIVLFAGLLSLIFYSVFNSSHRGKILRIFVFCCALIFVSMTGLNLFFHSKNIQIMKEQGRFNEVAIGNGPEIYYLELVLQYITTAKTRCNPAICEKLDSGLKNYYTAVATQIVKSTKELDHAIETNSASFSYWVSMENEKLKHELIQKR